MEYVINTIVSSQAEADMLVRNGKKESCGLAGLQLQKNHRAALGRLTADEYHGVDPEIVAVMHFGILVHHGPVQIVILCRPVGNGEVPFKDFPDCGPFPYLHEKRLLCFTRQGPRT